MRRVGGVLFSACVRACVREQEVRARVLVLGSAAGCLPFNARRWCLTLGRRWLPSAASFPVACAHRAPSFPELIGKMGEKCGPPPPPAPKACQGDESEPGYVGPAIVLTIGMIKQIVYLFYFHPLYPRVQKSFASRCRLERDFLQSQKPVTGRIRASLSLYFRIRFYVALNWFCSALLGLECLLNSGPEKRLKLQHESLG